MLFAGGAFGLAAIALWVFAVFDVIATDNSLCRNMPKHIWLLVVIFVPTVGSLAWLMLGRPQNTRFYPGDTRYRARPVGPEDLPDFSAKVRAIEDRRKPSEPPALEPPSISEEERFKALKAWEEDLKKREDAIKDQTPKDPDDGPQAP